MSAPRVLILMGSDSDWEVMAEARKALDEMGIAAEAHVSSAHRTPERTGRLAREAVPAWKICTSSGRAPSSPSMASPVVTFPG